MRPKGEPARFKRYPYGFGGSRLIAAVVAVVGGLGIAATGAVDVAYGGSSVGLIFCGLGVAVLGVGALFLALWMGKRNL